MRAPSTPSREPEGAGQRYGVNPKTVAKWKARPSVADVPTGPKEPRSTVLSVEEEAVVVAFRRHTLLPLDDCLYALQPTIPRLARSSLHRWLQRHGVGRLPQVEGDKEPRRKFRTYSWWPPPSQQVDDVDAPAPAGGYDADRPEAGWGALQ